MGKTRDLFEKTRHTKGTFYAKIGTIKDKNGKDKKQKQKRLIKDGKKYTEELYNKALNDPNNHYGVLTHLEPEILECEAKRVLRNITMNKASGGDGILAEVFQILKDDALNSASFPSFPGALPSTAAFPKYVCKVCYHQLPRMLGAGEREIGPLE